ncbi:PhpK family radical SAM P-methyltransferase [Candidatus Nitrospira neomarina]|uniref:PhpK family radical SAM P-methyltransferase n=1 Tax=Candidatus Nitrospira neomarina TaxID=3020899 RepID=A0AA96JXE4_9BACT|nr:PhpK family radical SAM P-methyltransferase [Candidatus Nitrospira neomarina]WNM63135.1 PhpK family radical SAM P-methyltransferase [Candidatus Nitrospira neomarina]
MVVGYHESCDDEKFLSLLDSFGELPIPLRMLLRNRLDLDGCSVPYLDALTHYTPTGSADLDRSIYTVAELPSLSTLYLVNYLRKRGRRVEFVNAFTYERSKLKKLLTAGPKSVAITTTFYMMPAPVIDIVRFIREHNDETVIIVGGPLIVNSCRDFDQGRLSRFLDLVGADLYVWESQGEASLDHIVGNLAEGRDCVGIPNVFVRSGSGWSLSARKPETNDLNECSIAWNLFQRADLGATVSTRTARSCAFKCAFCDYPERAGALALADVETVERELETLASMGVRRVAFIDDTFNVPMGRFEELCRMMARRAFGIEWYSYFRCTNVRGTEIFDLMRDAGCGGVLLGIESADDGILANMNKRAKSADYQFGIEELKKRDIFVHASLVVGFPGESRDTIKRSIDFLNQTGADTFAANHWYYLHSTPVNKMAALYNLKGSGHEWSHSTMNGKEAADYLEIMFDEVTGPAWMPVNGLDFWGVPYLLGKGMRANQVIQFLRLAKPMNAGVRFQKGTIQSESGKNTEDMRRFCENLSIEPSRYSMKGR